MVGVDGERDGIAARRREGSGHLESVIERLRIDPRGPEDVDEDGDAIALLMSKVSGAGDTHGLGCEGAYGGQGGCGIRAIREIEDPPARDRSLHAHAIRFARRDMDPET